MTELEITDEVERLIVHYKNMQNISPSMYNECLWQYSGMSNGLDVDDGAGTNIRQKYYKGYPDEFFTRVLVGLGELEFAAKVCQSE